MTISTCQFDVSWCRWRVSSGSDVARDTVRDVEQKSKTCSTRPSLVFPDRGTTRARACLTSLFEWEAVTQVDMAACNRDGAWYNMYIDHKSRDLLAVQAPSIVYGASARPTRASAAVALQYEISLRVRRHGRSTLARGPGANPGAWANAAAQRFRVRGLSGGQ